MERCRVDFIYMRISFYIICHFISQACIGFRVCNKRKNNLKQREKKNKENLKKDKPKTKIIQRQRNAILKTIQGEDITGTKHNRRSAKMSDTK